MPVTIKKSQLMYKNPSTGEYVSVDAVADKTSQQQINGINTAASNAIASINTAMQDIDTQPLTTLPKKAYKKDLVANEETLASAATHAYTVGDYFFVADNNNDISLYKATAAIAVGATISPGTGIDNNCVPAALANDVTSLSNDIDTVKADISDFISDFKNDVIKNYYGTWEQNRIMPKSGTSVLVEDENSTFCHSNFINTEENAIIEIAEGFQIFAWDGAFNELGHPVYQVTTRWETGTINYTHRSDYPYLAICVMKTNSANITPVEAASAIKVHTSTNTPFALKSSVNELSDDVHSIVNNVDKNTEDIFDIKTTLYSFIKYIYQIHNGKIAVSNNAITIQQDNTRAYTDYILMDDTVYLSIKTGYKYFAYLVDNNEGVSKTYSPIAPFSAWMNTDQHIDFNQTHPYLIVAVIKDTSGTITPEEASNALTISTNNENSIQKNIEVLNRKVNSIEYQAISNVPSGGQILYNADSKQQSNYIVNAMSYADGVIIACRANGSVVRIGYDGTEEILLEISGSNMDWRLCWIDSAENVYVSPHASYGALSATGRGLYRLAKNENSFTKVISLYNSTSSVPTETQNNNDTIWTMCEDTNGNLYAGVYAHTIRANPAIYKSIDGGLTWTYLINFNTAGLTTNGMHIHSIIYSKWQKALYCIVGEINTIFKSVDGGNTWIDLQVALKVKGTAMCATPFGIVIGSDGAYNCEIDILLNDDTTHKTVFSGWANTVFAIRRSDLTGFLYAFTKVDSSVNSSSYFPPLAAIEDSSQIDTWRNSVSVGVYNAWKAYYDSVINIYPKDAVRPQHYAIIVSRDGGATWEVLKKFTLTTSETATYIDGFWTTGFFKNGECLTGRMQSNTMTAPIVISEGKHKYVATGCDLDGEIFVRTNASPVVSVI